MAPETARALRRFRPAPALLALLILLVPAPAAAVEKGPAENLPPAAVITSPACDHHVAADGPTAVAFDGSASRDPDGWIARWSWDFGDGASGNGPMTSHLFAASGRYAVVLTVTDDDGRSSSDVHMVTLSPWADLRPVITSPPDGALLAGGEEAAFAFSIAPGAPAPGLASRWDFGDGATSAERAPRHAYHRPGLYIVRLSVVSLWGGTSACSMSVLVRPEPSSRTELSWTKDTIVSGHLSLENCSVRVQGNLTVSGQLTLSGSELLVDGPANGNFGIRVLRGGRLALDNGTTVRGADPDRRFSFAVLPGAILSMRDSRLSGCGRYGPGGAVAPSELGLHLQSNEAVISRCRISGNAAGVVVDQGTSPAISGSDISHNDGWGVLVLNGSAPLVQGNLLRGNGLLAPEGAGRQAAISSWSSSPAIFENTILGGPAEAAGRAVHGIVLDGPGRPNVGSNTIIGHRGGASAAGLASTASGAYLHDNTLLSNFLGLELSGGSARVERNIVGGEHPGPHEGRTVGLSDSTGSLFSGNTFSGYDIGARMRNGARSTFSSDAFTGNLWGLDCQSSPIPFQVTLANCTFSGNYRDVLVPRPDGAAGPGRLGLVNCSFRPERVELRDPDSVMTVGWHVDVLVLDGESYLPVAGAGVFFTGHGGSDAGAFLTGADGRTGPVALEASAHAPGFFQDRSSYQVLASEDGLCSVEWPMRLSGPSSLTLLLLRSSTSLAVVGGGGAPGGPVLAEAGRPLNLTAIGVPEPGSPDISYSWDFGDGVRGSGPEGAHVYERPGSYTVVLTAEHGGLEMVGTLRVEVRAGPAPPAKSPFPWAYLGMTLGLALVVGAAWFLGFTDIGLLTLGWALMLLYSKIARTKVLDNFLRGKIYGYVLANPGDHYNSIMDALKLSNGTFAYHIRLLEREKLVKSQSDGVYKRYYPADMVVPTSDRSELTKIQRMICDLIIEKPGINQREVAALLNLSSATVNYHIDTLIKKGHVRRERVGMKVRYYPLPGGRPREDSLVAQLLTPPV